jgi:arsenate reductase-like glutaredoxin family protein
MKARAALDQKLDADGFKLRNLVKEPLTTNEIEALARKVGGVENLVAPKRRAEAEGLSGKKLVAWLAADGGRIRRPIIVTPNGTTVGFAADAKERLAELL